MAVVIKERLMTRDVLFPSLADKVIRDMQIGLVNGLEWLSVSFGLSERRIKEQNGKRYYYPAFYVGQDEYVSLLPDDMQRSYSFFYLEDTQNVEHTAGQRFVVNVPFSLVVWVDMRQAGYADNRDTEAIKRDILRALLDGTQCKEGRFTINKIYERPDNVFSNYTLDEVDNQYLMSPFWGIRLTGELTIKDDCLL